MIEVILNWLLVQTVWASVIIAAIVLVKLLFRNSFSAVWEYGIWLLLLVRIAIPPISGLKGDFLHALNWGDASKLFTLWLSGLIATIIYSIAINFVFWMKVKNGTSYHDISILQILEELKLKMGVKTNVTLVQTSGIFMPAIFGLMRPWLLIPEWVVKDLKREELSYIILHELAHLKRLDIAFNWLSLFIQTIFWFNPLMWYGMSRMRKDREMACDATVLSAIDAARHKEYGMTILRVMDYFSKTYKLAGVAGVLENKSEVCRRLRMIAAYHKRKGIWQAVLVVILAVLLFTVPEKVNVLSAVNQAVTNEAAVEAPVGYKLMNFLLKQESKIDINKFQLVFTTDKAELWLQSQDLPEKILTQLKTLIETKIPELETYTETKVEAETRGYGKIVYLVAADDIIPQEFGSITLRADNVAVVLFSHRKLQEEQSVDNFFFMSSVRALCPPGGPYWLQEGISHYLGSYIRTEGEYDAKMINQNAGGYVGYGEILQFVGQNTSKSFKSMNEKNIFNVLSASFVCYLEQQIGMHQILEAYRSGNIQGELEKRARKKLEVLKQEWLQSLSLPSGATVNEYVGKAEGLSKMGYYKEALQYYERALLLDLNNYSACSGKAYCLLNLKRYEEALEAYNKVIELNPKGVMAYSSRAYVLNNLKRYDEALKSADKAIEHDANYANAYRHKCTALLSTMRNREALEVIEKAIKLDPGYFESYYKKGLALGNLNRLEEAIENYNKAIELRPGFADAHFHKARVYVRQGYADNAIEALKKTFELEERFKVTAKKDSAFERLKALDEFIYITAPSVRVNGNKLVLDVPPQTINGKMLLPARAIFEELGAAVEWDEAAQTATGIKNGTVVVLKIDSTEAKVNGRTVLLEAPAAVINGRTMVPARFLGESFGAKVDWDPNTESALITISNKN